MTYAFNGKIVLAGFATAAVAIWVLAPFVGLTIVPVALILPIFAGMHLDKWYDV